MADAINRAGGPKPWVVSFSYGRALQDAALATWRGRSENCVPAQAKFYHRARCNGLATLGRYDEREDSPQARGREPRAAAGWRTTEGVRDGRGPSPAL